MKKGLLVYLLVTALGLGHTVAAQDEVEFDEEIVYEGEIERGIRAGWQQSIIVINNEKVFTDPLNSFYIGFFTTDSIASFLKFEGGFEYYQAGGKTKDLDTELKLHYISVPLSLKFKLGPVYALGGVSGSVNLMGDYKRNGEDVGDKDFTTFNAGAHIGGGVKFYRLGIEARYNWGIIDVYQGYKTNHLQIGAVWYF